jgi:hypothetical protein
MKNLSKIALSVGLISGAILLGMKSSGSFANDRYFKISENHQSDTKQMLYGEVQPVSEITGTGSDQITVSYGLVHNDDKLGTQLGLAYSTVPKNKEHSLSMEYELALLNSNSYGFIPYIGGQVGLGMQLKSGSSFATSTSIDKAAYASGQPYNNTPSVGTFQNDPLFFLLGFQIGTKYKFTDHVNAFVAYDYQAKYMQVDYRLASSPSVDNQMTYNQRFNGIKAGMTYEF